MNNKEIVDLFESIKERPDTNFDHGSVLVDLWEITGRTINVYATNDGTTAIDMTNKEISSLSREKLIELYLKGLDCMSYTLDKSDLYLHLAY